MTAESSRVPESLELTHSKAEFEFGGRWLFLLLALCGLFYAYQFRVNAMSRVQAPFIADGVEYLTMARHVTEDLPLTVKPVRAGLFPLMLAVPLALERVWLGESESRLDGVEDPSIALWVLLLFNAFAVWGAYRLGCALRGRLTGLLAAFFTALLPLFTLWSFDYLTDVPAAAFGVWALVYWAERKPYKVGLMLGFAVLMRYQYLIPLGAFFVVPVLARHWRTLFKMSLGLIPAIIVLGFVDYLYWGEAFHSFLLYVPRQLTTFLPAGIVEKIFPMEAAASLPVAPMNMALEAIAAKSRTWYFENASRTITMPLGALLLLYPFARRSMRSKSGADMTVWIIATTVLVLSMQRYKESRYLVSIVPLVAALSSAGALWFITLIVRRFERAKRVGLVIGVVLLLGLGDYYLRSCLWLQRETKFAPFGAHLDAIESIPQESRPCTIGLSRPWLLLKDYPVRATGGWYWFSRDFASVDLGHAANFFKLTPDEWGKLSGRGLLDGLDYVVIRLPQSAGELGALRWLNEHTHFNGYFYNPRNNDIGTLLLRSNNEGGEPKPFWNLEDQRARDGVALAEFRAGVQLISVEAQALPTGANGYRIDTRWRLPGPGPAKVTAIIDVKNEHGDRVASFEEYLVYDEDYDRQARAGAALRASHYVHVLGRRGAEQLTFEVRVDVSVMGGGPPLDRTLQVPGEETKRAGEEAFFELTVPVQPAEPDEAPDAEVPRERKRSG